jgi:putative glycerol-1-phosphate prenyltransferase
VVKHKYDLPYIYRMNLVFPQFENLYQSRKKALAVLLDPDKINDVQRLNQTLEMVEHSCADFIFVGGSLMVDNHFHEVVAHVKKSARVPVVLFPGSPSQISGEADALLLLSLISGRNADLLIGQHVQAAPLLRKLGLETISTGYMLIDCGRSTTANYISQTLPIPYHKPEIAAVTAIAGEMLGLKTIYLDGGSGAEKPVSSEMIAAVRQSVDLPLIVGGGIRDEHQLRAAYTAGADIAVVGTAFEEEPELLFALTEVKNTFDTQP